MMVARIANLTVDLDPGGPAVVRHIDLDIAAGEIVGLVGESGSGKSTIANALLGYAKSGCHFAEGTVTVDGVDLLALSDRELRQHRGSTVAFIPQDPAAALNPSMRIGRQIAEMLQVHEPSCLPEDRDRRVQAVLAEVGLPQTDDFLKRHSHQLSGGQQQRIAIAMAFILMPRLIVLDEPTTGLDVTTQQRILDTVRDLCDKVGTAAVLVSHDLAVMSQVADRVYVAYAGRIVECAPSDVLFKAPRHPYTRALLASTPKVKRPVSLTPIGGNPPGPGSSTSSCAFQPRCSFASKVCALHLPGLEATGEEGHAVRCFHADAVGEAPSQLALKAPSVVDNAVVLSVRQLNAFHGSDQVLSEVDLDVLEGECLAIVGESGSGKTTLSRAIVGLMPTWQGSIAFRDESLAQSARSRPSELRRRIQYIFQSPYNSLNPRRTVGQSIASPRTLFFGERGQELQGSVNDALERVSLSPSLAHRYPDQLSGGERQRVSIARALACEPDLLICDEVTSALDVSVQASIVNMLDELRADMSLTLLFVTHNLALVRSIASRVLVMFDGRVLEVADAATIFSAPQTDYARRLLADTPDVRA